MARTYNIACLRRGDHVEIPGRAVGRLLRFITSSGIVEFRIEGAPDVVVIYLDAVELTAGEYHDWLQPEPVSWRVTGNDFPVQPGWTPNI